MSRRPFFRILLLCLALSLGRSSCADEASRSAITAALRSGEIERGFTLALQSARGGDAWAMDIVGLLLLSGPAPLDQDYRTAGEWLSKAAAAGNGDAMSRLGEMHFNGWGVVKDEAAAVEWYRRGSTQGSHAAMNNLASCLMQGKGVARDVDAGLALLRQAAGSDPIAKENLARLERSGELGSTNPQEALSLFEQSAGQGSSTAMVAVAQMFFNGEGVAKDVARSCRWAILAHTKGRKEASAHIANVCRTQLSREAFAREADEAKRWVEQHPEAFGPLARP